MKTKLKQVDTCQAWGHSLIPYPKTESTTPVNADRNERSFKRISVILLSGFLQRGHSRSGKKNPRLIYGANLKAKTRKDYKYPCIREKPALKNSCFSALGSDCVGSPLTTLGTMVNFCYWRIPQCDVTDGNYKGQIVFNLERPVWLTCL